MMPVVSGRAAILRIGKWRVDPALNEISSDGRTVRLEPLEMRLLLCLARHSGRPVELQQLLDEVWTGVIVAQGSVYQAIGQLRRTLGDDTEHPTYIETLPRKGYRLIAPIAVISERQVVNDLSPSVAADDAPPGSPPPAKGGGGAPQPQVRHRSLIFVLIAIALLSGAALTWIWSRPFAPAVTTTVPDKSVAVLPFVNMSDSKDQEYFSDGLSDQLIVMLARVPELRVPGRTSSFYFKGKQATLGEISKALNVAYVLEGSVRKSGDTIRITVQLIRAGSGYHLWSETYDRQLSDIFVVQDEISHAVVTALKAALTTKNGASSTHQPGVEAYTALLRGDFYVERHTKADEERAVDSYKEAIDEDPIYALAWARLASSYFTQAYNSWVSAQEGAEAARSSVKRALEIDPSLVEAHCILGLIERDFWWDWKGSQAEFERAHDLDPAAVYPAWEIALSEALQGNVDRWIVVSREWLTTNPLDPVVLGDLGWSLFVAGRLRESEATWRTWLQMFPESASGHSLLGLTLIEMGRPTEAIAVIEREPDEGWKVVALPAAYWAAGRRAESDASLNAYEQKFGDRFAYNIAAMHAYRGELDAAFEWLDRAYRQRDGGIQYVKIDPMFRNLHRDPRFMAFLRRVQLLE